MVLTFSSPYAGLILRMRKPLYVNLKINRSVQTPWLRPSIRVASSVLWAPDMCLLKSATSSSGWHYWVITDFNLFRSMLFGRLAWHVLSTPLLQYLDTRLGVSKGWRLSPLSTTQTTPGVFLWRKTSSRSTLNRKMMHLLYLASSLCCPSLKLSWLLLWQKSVIQATRGLNSPPSQCTLCIIRYGNNGIVTCNYTMKHTVFSFV